MKQYLLFIIFIIGCNKPNSVSSKNIDTLHYKLVIADSANKEFIGKEFAELELKRFIEDSSYNVVNGVVLINTKNDLIQFAEPFLFKIYGQKEILDERPYEVHLFGDNWLMMGTLPKGSLGGTFSIVVNRKTCEILGISHGK
jgi:hypothetical protein